MQQPADDRRAVIHLPGNGAVSVGPAVARIGSRRPIGDCSEHPLIVHRRVDTGKRQPPEAAVVHGDVGRMRARRTGIQDEMAAAVGRQADKKLIARPVAGGDLHGRILKSRACAVAGNKTGRKHRAG